jgi:hypothetical protein
MRDGMVEDVVHRRTAAARVPPIRTPDGEPPGGGTGPAHDIVLLPPESEMEHGGVPETLRVRQIPRLLDEYGEVGVGDTVGVDTEGFDGHAM